MERSEIKKAYKQARRHGGVYGIRNSRDNTVFVGCAADLQARINRHKAELKFGSHRNSELQEMWNAYGESAVRFEILEVLDHEEGPRKTSEEDMRTLARMWIEKLEEAGARAVLLD